MFVCAFLSFVLRLLLFSISKGEAFETDDFVWQARMIDAMLTGLEQALVGFTCVY